MSLTIGVKSSLQHVFIFIRIHSPLPPSKPALFHERYTYLPPQHTSIDLLIITHRKESFPSTIQRKFCRWGDQVAIMM